MGELVHVPYRHAQIFSGNANPDLAMAVAEELDTELSPRQLEPFSDGEIKCRLENSVRGNYVFVIQSHGGGDIDVNRAIVEQQLLCNAAADGSAAKVIAICPYFGYSRQDRKSAGREPIAAKLIATSLRAAGANGLVGIDLHAGQIQGFFDGPFDNLTAAPLLRQAMLPYLEEGVVVVSPDPGRVKVAAGHRKRMGQLNPGSAYIDKVRPPGTMNQVEALEVVGNVEGRQCLVVDDMVDSANTLRSTADLLVERGAKEVLAMATHGVLSGNAINNIGESALRRLILTDTRALTPEQQALNTIEKISVAKMIAQGIHEIFTDGSISKLFEGENHS